MEPVIISLKRTLKLFYLSTNEGTFITKSNYLNLISDLPAELVYKLKLAPVPGLDKRLRHLIALYIESSTGETTHIEGIGVDYNVRSSDICVDGVEIDFTIDESLYDEKLERLKETFDNCEVKFIKNKLPDLDFKLADTSYYDMYKNIVFTDELDSAMDSIYEEFNNRLDGTYKDIKAIKPKHDKPMSNYDNNDGIIKWASVSKERDLIDFILNSFGPEAKERATEVSSAAYGDFTFSLLEALKFGTEIKDKTEAYLVNLDDNGNEYLKTEMPIFNTSFTVLENYDLAIGYSKYDRCLRAVFSSKFDNYTDVNRRITLKKGSSKADRAIKETKIKFNSVEEIMLKYKSIIDDLSDEPLEGILRKSYLDSANQVVDHTVSSFITTNYDNVSNTIAFAVSDHLAEIAESVMASQKFKSRANEYRLCKNGKYKSYSLVQMTGTNDSFETANFFTMYVPSKISAWMGATKEIVITPFRTMSRNRATWFSQIPEKLINLSMVFSESNNYMISSNDIAQLFLFLYQNNNNFSSICEQTRYLFVSATSKKEVISSIFEKKILPMMHHKNIFQAVHILKILKMAEVVTSYAQTGNLSKIMAPFNIFMPALDKSMTTFQDCINASYIYTAFNKFSTFKLIRASKVYNDLLDEREIYATKKEDIENELDKIRYKDTESIILWLTRSKYEIVNDMTGAMLEGPKRFTFNAFMLLSLMRNDERAIENHYGVKESLLKSPIDACSMRGGMSDGANGKNYSCRAAETIFSGITSNAMKPIKDITNVSIYALKCQEMANDLEYLNRIETKDQVGSRDVSILNYAYRIGALFCESITKAIAKGVDESVLNDTNKAKKFDEVMRTYKVEDEILDTNDQSRWGPNAIMEIFYISYCKRIKDEVLLRMMAHTFKKISEKKMRVPDNIVRFKGSGKEVKVETEVDKLMKRIDDNTFFSFEFSMGQGILHQTSDLYHVYANRVLDKLSSSFGLFKIVKTLITSDDCFRKIKPARYKSDWRKIEWFISGIMGMMNIIRNTTKSFLSTHIGEFNSEFYNNKILVIPTIKKCISEIDCGAGMSLISDLLSATLTGTTSLSDGATIVLSDSVAVASLSLTIRQWNYFSPRTDKVLNGGYPCINSLIGLISGSIGVLAMSDDVDDIKNAMGMYYATPDEFVNYTDVLRINYVNEEEKKRKIHVLQQKGTIDGKILLTRDVSGIANLTTYKRRATIFTQLVRKIVVDKVYLKRYVSIGEGFLFNFKMQFSKLSYIGDTHDYFKRYTDPSRSFDSKSFKLKTGELISRRELYDYMLNKKYDTLEIPGSIYNLIEDSILRSIAIYERIIDEDADYTHTKEVKKIYQNRLTIDMIGETNKESLLENMFRVTEGTDLARYMTANSLVNALYGTSPTSVKVRLYTKDKVTLSKAVNSIIMHRTAANIERASKRLAITKGHRALSKIAIEAKETKEILEKVAMNYCLNEDKRTYVRYEENTVTKAIIVDENLTKLGKIEMENSASGKDLAYLTLDSMRSMMLSQLLTKTVFKSDSRMIKLWYPKSDRKYAVVTNKELTTNTWCHYVFGDDDHKEVMRDWNDRMIPMEECFFLSLQKTSTIKIAKDCPMMYTTISNVEIPILWVAPKLFETKEDVWKSFPDLGEVTNEVISVPYGLDPENIIARVINDRDVTNEELYTLLPASPSRETLNMCLRILGQNLYTSRLVDTESASLTVMNGSTIDIFNLIENLALDDLADMNDDASMANKAIEITKVRAANSLGFTIARIIREHDRMYRVSLINELRKVFTAKLVGCAIIVACNEKL